MKGITKAFARTPHQFTSKMGLAKKSSDPEFDDYNRKFTDIEKGVDKLLQDAKAFKDAVNGLLYSGSTFAGSFTTLFSPMGSEYDLTSKHPQAENTLRNIGQYQTLMQELRETLAPELELIESRVLVPTKELQEIVKKIRKTITKRDHKLIDFDRHNNTYSKLRDKKEKSLSDEKNIFKVEQDFELASSEYEHWNNLCKQELPVFLQMAAKFVAPLFHSFYFMQLNVFYLMQDKIQTFIDGKYDISNTDIEGIYLAQRGEVAEQIEGLTITKRQVSTAKLMAERRGTTGSTRGSLGGRSPSISSDNKVGAAAPGLARSSSAAKYNLPPPAGGAASTSAAAAPPPYTPGASGAALASAGSVKKAPPPPPPIKRGSSMGRPVAYCTALYDYAAQAEGDLSFKAGDRIEIVERTETQDDWWTGRLNGVQGVFPASYTQAD